MRRSSIVLALVAGCGRAHFDAHFDARADAAGDAGEIDAVVDGPELGGCWPLWRAHTIVPDPPLQVTELVYNDQQGDPAFTDGALRLYFRRYTDGVTGNDIYTTTRPDRASPWTGPVLVTELQSLASDLRTSISENDLIGVFSSNRNGDYDLWGTERTTTAAAFDPPSNAAFTNLDTAMDEFDPELMADGLVLYYAPTIAGIQQIARASRGSLASPFDPPVAVPLGGPAMADSSIADPTVSPDEKVIVVTINAPDPDLYYATRASASDPFGPLTQVPNVNQTSAEHDAELSEDGCELMFRTNRIGIADFFTTTIR